MVRKISVSLPPDLIERVKEQAEEEDVKTSWLVKQALKEYLGEETEETEESEDEEDLDEEAPASRKRKGNPDLSQVEDAIQELKGDISDIKEAIASFVGLRDKVKERKVSKPKAKAEEEGEEEEAPWWAWEFEEDEEEED